MNWEAVGAVANLVAAGAVVASLLYLGIQVRQTNRQAEAAAQVEWIKGWNEVIKAWIHDTETISAVRNGFQDIGSLSDDEMAVFHMHLAAMTNHWLLASELYERGLLPDSLYRGCTDVVVSVHSTPGGRKFLERNADATPRGPELLQLVESQEGRLPPITEVFPWWGSNKA